MSLMKNKLELLGLCFKKYRLLFLKRGMHTKKTHCIFKTMFTVHQNTLNCVYNPLKYNKPCLNILLGKVSL